MMKVIAGIGVALLVAFCDEAQRMAGKLNQNANALAADAAKTIADVLASTPTR